MQLVEGYVDTVMGTEDIMATVITDRIEALGPLLAPGLAQQSVIVWRKTPRQSMT